MRLDGAKLAFNTHYPFTYKPTKLPEGGNPVTLSGYFLADELPPGELLRKIRNHLDPSPDEPGGGPEEMLRMASACIKRSFEAACSTGHFASGPAPTT